MQYIKDGKGSYSVVIGGRVMTFDSSHRNYIPLVECIKNNDHKKFERVFCDGVKIQSWSDGNFQCKNGILTYDGQELPEVIQTRILGDIADGFDCKGLLRFTEKAIKSGRYRTVQNLLSFLEHQRIAISRNGNIIAWKGVKKHVGDEFTDYKGRLVKQGDYVDVRTGTIRNNVGDINDMPAHLVEDNPDKPCGPGLHIAALRYAQSWTTDNNVVQVEIDPRHIVSIPRDHNCEKARCSKYKVTGEYNVGR